MIELHQTDAFLLIRAATPEITSAEETVKSQLAPVSLWPGPDWRRCRPDQGTGMNLIGGYRQARAAAVHLSYVRERTGSFALFFWTTPLGD